MHIFGILPSLENVKNTWPTTFNHILGQKHWWTLVH